MNNFQITFLKRELNSIKQNYYQITTGDTLGHILAYQKHIPEECLCSQPDVKNKIEMTVAMILASSGIIPPVYLQHKQNLKCHFGDQQKTVAELLSENKIVPPLFWMQGFDEQETKIIYGQVIKNLQSHYLPAPKTWNIQQFDQFDFACFGIIENVNVDNLNLQNYDCFTIPMILAANDIKVPEQWYQDINIKNRYDQTLGEIYALKGIYNHYYQNISNIENKQDKQRIINAMINNKYYYKDNYFVANCKLNQYKRIDPSYKCQICNNIPCDQEQFVVTTCKCKICFRCLQIIQQTKGIIKCPICQKENWFETQQQFIQDNNKQNDH